MKRKYTVSVIGSLLAFCLAGWMPQAGADLITFSGPIDSNPSVDPSVLDATIDYSFSAGVLTLIITNETAVPDEYTLSVLHFNTSGDVTGLSILDDGGLSNTSLSSPALGGGMGTFDWGFDLGQGNNGILAGNSETVTFSVIGSNLDTSDFFNGLSIAPGDGNGNFVATIHFARGPNDLSDWVTPGEQVIPEPATLSLLGLGIAAAIVRSARKRPTA